MPEESSPPRLPFFYGWVIVGVAFVTMGVGVNARTAFSLLFSPILGEFGWERGVTAGAFSFGFLVSAVLSPALGRLMDRRGPRVVMELGVGLVAAGLMLATLVQQPWHLYATLGVLVGGGSICLSYTGQALFLPAANTASIRACQAGGAVSAVEAIASGDYLGGLPNRALDPSGGGALLKILLDGGPGRGYGHPASEGRGAP